MAIALLEMASLAAVWACFGFGPCVCWFFALWTIKVAIYRSRRVR